jgi:NAD(P)-dependent dehydrogenase (short-subunit alcohol dehydrogenase family)
MGFNRSRGCYIMSNSENKRIYKYFREYQWSNIFAMIRNNRRDPNICIDDFKNKLVIISGATSGIGYHTAKKFASHGADLLCINRNIEKSESLKKEIENEYGVKCGYEIADLSSLSEIHNLATKLSLMDVNIDVLIHNAGVYLTQKELTEDNLEKVFVVHYLSSFILNYVLMDKLKSQKEARIIMVSSEGHRFAAWGLKYDDLNFEKQSYTGLKSYGAAKLAQLLSMIIFNEHFQNTGVTINSMHPGAVKTETGQDNGKIYKWFKRNFLDKHLRKADISAEALYYLGASKEILGVSGKFFNLTTEEIPAPPALDYEAAKIMWNKSIEMSKINMYYHINNNKNI